MRKEGIHVCKQSIYNHVHADVSVRLAQLLPHRLECTRRQRKQHPTEATSIAGRTSICQCPPEADGKRFGGREMDAIVDSCGHAILILTERSTDFILMEKLPQGRKAKRTAQAVARLLFPYGDPIKTITTDNGRGLPHTRTSPTDRAEKDGKR